MIRPAAPSAADGGSEGKYAQIRMALDPEFRKILLECKATVGQLGNTSTRSSRIGKGGPEPLEGLAAGRCAVLGDESGHHPHGGGRGQERPGQPAPVIALGPAHQGIQTRVNKRATKFHQAARQGEFA